MDHLFGPRRTTSNFGLMATLALQAAGWKVEHNSPTVVICRRAVLSAKNKEGYNTIGITSTKD